MMMKILTRMYQLLVIIKYSILKFINLLLFNKKNEVFLISERGIDARDNGYVFYNYLKTNHPELTVKYVIDKKSSDIDKINKDDIIFHASLKHYFYYMNSKYLISTHAMGYSPNMRVFLKLNKIKWFKPKGIQVFLQHGIINNYLKEITKEKLDIDIFISGAKKEYKYLLENFGFDKDTIKLTGLARYDNLKGKTNNDILLMPTWRKKYFYTISDKKFKQTDYYKKFNSLINNDRLIEYLRRNDSKLIFYLHHEMQKYAHCFIAKSDRIIIANENKYDIQELLKKSKILITDYSSVFYDFAYMRKNIIYFQFDYNDFYSNHYKEGYFNFVNDGFGPVFKYEDDVIDYIIKYKNIERKYLNRINEFFSFNDYENCERIYTEIIKKG